MKKILIVGLFVLAGCRPSVEERMKARGSTVPRNAREQVIFDYFYALREQRYEDAYQLRAPSPPSPKDFLHFKKTHQENHASLATHIAVGEEARGLEDDPCESRYTVYAVEPDRTTLFSGLVSVYSKPDQPGVCLIGYNSAFGSFP